MFENSSNGDVSGVSNDLTPGQKRARRFERRYTKIEKNALRRMAKEGHSVEHIHAVLNEMRPETTVDAIRRQIHLILNPKRKKYKKRIKTQLQTATAKDTTITISAPGMRAHQFTCSRRIADKVLRLVVLG